MNLIFVNWSGREYSPTKLGACVVKLWQPGMKHFLTWALILNKIVQLQVVWKTSVQWRHWMLKTNFVVTSAAGIELTSNFDFIIIWNTRVASAVTWLHKIDCESKGSAQQFWIMCIAEPFYSFFKWWIFFLGYEADISKWLISYVLFVGKLFLFS